MVNSVCRSRSVVCLKLRLTLLHVSPNFFLKKEEKKKKSLRWLVERGLYFKTGRVDVAEGKGRGCRFVLEECGICK